MIHRCPDTFIGNRHRLHTRRGWTVSLLAKNVRTIEDSFVKLLKWSPGSKEEKQEFFRRRTKTLVTKSSYAEMWSRLTSEFKRSGAGQLVFDYVLRNAPPALKERLRSAQRNSFYPRRPEDPKIIEVLFWKNGNPRRITEHLLEYLDESSFGGISADDNKNGDCGSRPFDIALSFAGEQRDYVGAVYQHLDSRGVNVFYDEANQVELWGKDLNEHLHRVFRDQARYCAMFISEEYVEKNWPRHEGQAALERELEENREYVLPVRFDRTPLPGLPETIGYVEAPEDPVEVAEMILSKIEG